MHRFTTDNRPDYTLMKNITSDEMFSLVESLETPYINYKEKLGLKFRAW